MMKRVIQITVVVLATLIAGACSFKSQNPIVGKWKAVDNAQTIEFTKEGSLSFSGEGRSLSGNYKLIDEGRVQIDIGGRSEIFSVKITGEELSMTHPNESRAFRYKRV
jgi:hypothetical protein